MVGVWVVELEGGREGGGGGWGRGSYHVCCGWGEVRRLGLSAGTGTSLIE